MVEFASDNTSLTHTFFHDTFRMPNKLDDRPPLSMFYVYILKSKKDGKLYFGFTDDLRRRILEHNAGKSPATKNRGPFELVYYEAYKAKTDALIREKSLKQFKNGYTRLKQRLTNSLQT